MREKAYGIWQKLSYGKRLKKLHFWNAVVIGLLALTGIILFTPSFRRLGQWRVWIKDLHVALGFISIFLIALYLPLLVKHWKQLSARSNQQMNLAYILFVLAGWSVTGLMLWRFRDLPPSWSNPALIGHDLFTWIGVPYAVYHAISRSHWVKKSHMAGRPVRPPKHPEDPEKLTAKYLSPSEMTVYPPLSGKPNYSRRRFLRAAAGTAVAAAAGPFFYRWLKLNLLPNTAAKESLPAKAPVSAKAPSSANPLTNARRPAGEHPQADKKPAPAANEPPPEPVPLPGSNPPIGGGGSGHFRIYTVTNFPKFNAAAWTFTVTGLVKQPLEFNWEQFLKVKRKVQVSDFHCVTGWSVNHLTWEGIPLSDLLDMAGVKPQAQFVKLYSGDRVYTDALTLEQARMSDVMAAVLMDGKPLPREQGGPVRLVVPKMYGYKSVKWLQKMELTDQPHKGYWEVRGYDTNAWLNSRSPL